ncbi:site-specific integrase [Caballeronia novacaledonica]|uniref:Tyrosine-type recombinase/integrase n=1 Tax=Caballeronia novacaledonica TaxID=1544861 RepID=A0AA37IBW6_9BURK|nr:site-specific integrase [Caballeronia novacaledonica]GJH23801.1 tyrosine-type recombinase/integrase [Caballeronia novacaledonica]
MLENHGVDPFDPEGDERALDAFLAAMEDQLPPVVRDDPAFDRGPQLDAHLPLVYSAAFQVVQDRREFTLGDCLDQYIAARPSTTKTAKIAFRYLREYLGKDKDIRKVRRAEVNGFVQHLLEGGHSEDGTPITTGTVGRYLNSIKAAFGRAIRENELGIENVFVRVEIPNKGEDVTEREPFTVGQYQHLYRAIDRHAETRGLDQIRCILILLAETGARLAEIVGLAVADVHVGAKVPFLSIQDRPWRRLKTRSSIREVPLTQRALAAAQTALRQAHGSPFLFPRYTDETGSKADTASVALIEWIRSREGLRGTKLGNHSLRHGMEDLLRAVGCPDSVRDQITGHKTPGIGASYGRGYPLEHLADWVAKAVAPVDA